MRPSHIVIHDCEGWNVAVDDRGQLFVDCSNTTDKGMYCDRHARDLLGLEVKHSTLQGAGLGLFATRSFSENEVVDEYKGNVLDRHDFLASPSAYGTDISLHRVIDSIESTSCDARFSNDARSVDRNNAQLWSDRQYGLHLASRRYTNGSGAVVHLVAKRAICAGEEVFNGYGDRYWKDMIGEDETEMRSSDRKKRTGFTGRPHVRGE